MYGLEGSEEGFSKRNDQPPALLKTSKLPVASTPLMLMVPVHCASDLTITPFAMCSFRVDGFHPFKLCLAVLKVVRDIAPVIAPSSKSAWVDVLVPSGFMRVMGWVNGMDLSFVSDDLYADAEYRSMTCGSLWVTSGPTTCAIVDTLRVWVSMLSFAMTLPCFPGPLKAAYAVFLFNGPKT